MGLLLLRFLVGWVFLSEGIQKFLFPAAMGEGDCTRLDSVAAVYGAVRGRDRNGVRQLVNPWPLLQPGGLAFAYS
jgi:hypothetical protein